MDKIYEDACDVHVAAVITYTDGTSLYADKDKMVKVTPEEAMNLCFKSTIVYNLTSTTYFNVKSFKESGGTVTVTLSDDTALTVSPAEE